MKTEYKSIIFDNQDQKWNFSTDINVTIDEGCMDLECQNIVLEREGQKLVCTSLAEFPTEFKQEDVNVLEEEITHEMEQQFSEELEDSGKAAEKDYWNWRQGR